MTRRSVVALIPARLGSKRVPGKNVRVLRGHPLIAYTIVAAIDSGVFGSVVVSTDDPETQAMARHYGAEAPFLRPPELAGDLSPDIDWVLHALDSLARAGRTFDAFSILRPTSPLRSPRAIREAVEALLADEAADSLRAVELCAQHPGKMWTIDGDRMTPLLDDAGAEPPWHSRPYQALPVVYAQNASLEVAWVRTALESRSIAGQSIRPHISAGVEGFDINRAADWRELEYLLDSGLAELPMIPLVPFPAENPQER